MSLLFRIVRIILLLHALNNIVSGTYMLFTPSASAKSLSITNIEVPKMLALGMLSVGTYGIISVLSNSRQYYVSTFCLRAVSVLVFLTCAAPLNKVAVYEAAVALLAGAAAYLSGDDGGNPVFEMHEL